jgi:hypothetical protein
MNHFDLPQLPELENLTNLPIPHPKQLPTAVEIQYATLVINDLDKGIGSLKTKIHELQVQLQGLQKKRKNYLSYIAPFRRLPAEIVSEIVWMWLYDGGYILDLAHINSQFRNAVFGTRSIWRHIRLTSEDDPPFWFYRFVSQIISIYILIL